MGEYRVEVPFRGGFWFRNQDMQLPVPRDAPMFTIR
jgi:hypothetical protein